MVAFLLALGTSFVFSLPIGIIQAITNTQIASSDTSFKSISGQSTPDVVKIELPVLDQLWLRFGTGVKYASHLLRVHIG